MMTRFFPIGLRSASLVLAVVFACGCGPKSAKTVSSISALEAYVAEAKATNPTVGVNEGSLWVAHGSRTDLFRDPRARDINDVVTLRVQESTQASAAADTKNSKTTAANASYTGFFGAQNSIKELPNLIAGKAANTFEGSGATTRNTTLSTNMTARVVDVLPNGYLVIEGVREIRLNNENQVLYLTGVVRPEDISRNNVVLSSSVAQMTVRLQGHGTISQHVNPGWLYKILNNIMPF
jgi:flagellar L-ring protein precursor FlgH